MKEIDNNLITYIDGYKLDHRRQYPPGTQRILSNWTARSSRIEDQDEVVFLGLQYFLRKYLMEESKQFFNAQLNTIRKDYERLVESYIGPNVIGSRHIADLHELGYFPLEFKALPEGTAVPLRVPMLTVENTDDRFFWLVNYIETLMSSVLWMPCTSATTALRMRKLLDKYAALTGSPPEFVPFQGHDFSFRGMPGPEAAMLSGLGHLVYFVGTDTVPAINFTNKYYPEKNTWSDDYLIGASVAATEHSVMCAGGEESELKTFERLLRLYPDGIISVVSDTWDFWNVLTNILPTIKEKILARNGKLVIRPDSGDPVLIVCGDPKAPKGTPAYKGTIELLWETFGGTITETGHKMLDSHIGCIYGDSITFDRAQSILERLHEKGFASANMVFGIGSYSYQYTTRDTYGFAMKATWAQIDDVGIDMFKDPKTDDGVKKSAKGRIAVLEKSSGGLILVDQADKDQEERSLLKTVWKNGSFARGYEGSFKSVRERALLNA